MTTASGPGHAPVSPADDQIPAAVLDELPRFFAGEPRGTVDVEAWAGQHPRHRALLDAARRLWDAAAPDCASGCGADESAHDVDAAWGRFQARVTGRAAGGQMPEGAEPGAGNAPA